MSGWAGFSDEELRKMQQKDSAGSAAPVRGRKLVAANRNRQQLHRERALQSKVQKNAGAGSLVLPPEQLLSKPSQREDSQAASPAETPTVKQEVQQKPNESHQPTTEEENAVVKELDKQEVELREKTRLEELQQEQRIIEERNKRNKALLAKTIAEKSKQTHAEAVKLKRIQKELQALDDMVSSDIGILRGKIEQASWDYTAARKRYEKAEAEYVIAKLDLHKKTEVKEQLTEHLCAVIQQNELRKAHKLEELMQQLQLQASEEKVEKQNEVTRRNLEMQKGEEKGNGSVECQEAKVQSTKNREPKEEETVTKETGGSAQPDEQSEIEHSKAEQDCKTLENCLQSEAVAS